ncbi:hypothetical protein AVEN_2133-1 [Araneus ventricosus]|uniref:Uncharacterized protein n=1 Tax=Araneus ventricosus TaxID=182803 RepID=A0A4Y2E9B0_ARAVE|nr:hypothetical protein AVEN_2133-1 [Araneus ventricosus]
MNGHWPVLVGVGVDWWVHPPSTSILERGEYLIGWSGLDCYEARCRTMGVVLAEERLFSSEQRFLIVDPAILNHGQITTPELAPSSLKLHATSAKESITTMALDYTSLIFSGIGSRTELASLRSRSATLQPNHGCVFKILSLS